MKVKYLTVLLWQCNSHAVWGTVMCVILGDFDHRPVPLLKWSFQWSVPSWPKVYINDKVLGCLYALITTASMWIWSDFELLYGTQHMMKKWNGKVQNVTLRSVSVEALWSHCFSLISSHGTTVEVINKLTILWSIVSLLNIGETDSNMQNK